MRSYLPLIVGFGGYNAAGRASGHRAYERMIYESLGQADQRAVVDSLRNLRALSADVADAEVLAGTLVRKLEADVLDADQARLAVNVELQNTAANNSAQFELSARQMPAKLPENWHVEPMDEGGKRFRITVAEPLKVRVPVTDSLQVKAAGQLPSGFKPGDYYRSTHHPRGLQMSVLGASDAVNSVGIDWQRIQDSVDPDDVAVYSSSVMCQLDDTGVGGMMNARVLGQRSSSKQLSLGFTSMPADFTNAYVLGSLGATGAVTGACATFLYNLRWAVEDLRRGRRKVAVVGCAEAPILPEVIDGFAAMSALATDDDLRKLDGVAVPDYRRASRPFGANCGFTIAESSQYVVLMADDLAIELGAQIYGAVPGVYVNADGFKKSISAPGAGNYLTMAKAVGVAKTLLGDELVRNSSFVQAHGSSTPQNRVTESRIFDEVAKAFGMERWPVAAVKAYVGHSLGPASGDQLAATLGVFNRGIVPGIKTIDAVADDVFASRLSITSTDQQLGQDACQIAFLNSKGFGGNNATATVFAPDAINGYLKHHYSNAELKEYEHKRELVVAERDRYLAGADAGQLQPRYNFGNDLIDENGISLNDEEIRFPGFAKAVSLKDSEGLEGF
ncbi:beta-ketoacyl synthase [Agaribacterium haliotis]|uniref:beta-ketoacyl synthase n=1 Tax=Agaribacterium haliotis TaxID=2013869 RepID=UPI000BB567DC|nr:beta-ketoacyl synthase [Agaribacterium haliotis]